MVQWSNLTTYCQMLSHVETFNLTLWNWRKVLAVTRKAFWALKVPRAEVSYPTYLSLFDLYIKIIFLTKDLKRKYGHAMWIWWCIIIKHFSLIINFVEKARRTHRHIWSNYNKRLKPKTQFQDFIFKTNWLSTVTINKSKQCLLLNRAEFTTSKLIFLFGSLNNISLNLLIRCFKHV